MREEGDKIWKWVRRFFQSVFGAHKLALQVDLELLAFFWGPLAGTAE